MPRLKSNLVSVYVMRERPQQEPSPPAGPPNDGTGLEVLLLQRSADHAFPGDWQCVHGHIEEGETAWQAALREVQEETGITPICWYRLVRVSSFYAPENDTIYLVPAFVGVAAPGAGFRLSHEHQAGVWCAPTAARDRFSWVTQRDAIDDIIAAIQRWPQTGPELTRMDVDAVRRSWEQRADHTQSVTAADTITHGMAPSSGADRPGPG